LTINAVGSPYFARNTFSWSRVSHWGRRPLGGHEQRPLLNSSTVILQNPIDEQGATSVDSLWKGATNHERLRTTVLVSCDKVQYCISIRSRSTTEEGRYIRQSIEFYDSYEHLSTNVKKRMLSSTRLEWTVKTLLVNHMTFDRHPIPSDQKKNMSRTAFFNLPWSVAHLARSQTSVDPLPFNKKQRRFRFNVFAFYCFIRYARRVSH